jgi:hypothetical protein
MNLNQNFQLLKNDFSQPLKLIENYLSVASPAGALKSVGLSILYKLSQGTTSVNLSQRVLALKITIRVLRACQSYEPDAQELYRDISEKLPLSGGVEQMNHEARLNLMVNVAIVALFAKQVPPAIVSQTEGLSQAMAGLLCLSPATTSLTPNLIEQIKFLCVCLKKVGQSTDLSHSAYLPPARFNDILDYLIGLFKRNELDPVFRCYILATLPGILKRV